MNLLKNIILRNESDRQRMARKLSGYRDNEGV